MSYHIRDERGVAMCKTTYPDNNDRLCVLCEMYANTDKDHPCDVYQEQSGFVARCECGWSSRVKPTPSHAESECRAHWRETLGELVVSKPKKPKPEAKTKVCHCGCTELTAGGRFKAGHDARWLAKLRLAVNTGEMSEQEAKRQVGEVSEKLLLKFQHALQGRVVS
jgi:hypothetical protein